MRCPSFRFMDARTRNATLSQRQASETQSGQCFFTGVSFSHEVPQRVVAMEVAVDEHAEPELETEQGPEARSFVRPRQVAIDRAPDIRRVQVTARRASGVAEQNVERPTQRPSEPAGQGYLEALLRTVNAGARYQIPGVGLQEMLGLESLEVQGDRQSRRELDHAMIEERRAGLERVGHRGDVHLHQEIVGEVDLDPYVHGALDVAQPIPAPVDFATVVGGIGGSKVRAESGRVQPISIGPAVAGPDPEVVSRV